MKFFKIILVFSFFLVKCLAYGGNGGISLAGPQSTSGGSSYDAPSGTNDVSLSGGGSGDIAGPISLSGPSRSSGGSYSGGGGSSLGRYQAAIFTKHTVETKPVMTSNELTQPAIIEVDGGDLPLELVFKSTTSRLKVRQQHVSSNGGQIQETNSEEPVSILRNTVRRPIIQEIREIIVPSRRIIQEVIETIIARAQSLTENRGQNGGTAPQIGNGGNGANSLGSPLGLDLNSRSFAGGNGGGNGGRNGAGVGVAGNGASAYSPVSGNSLNGNNGLSLPVNVPIASGSTGTKGGY